MTRTTRLRSKSLGPVNVLFVLYGDMILRALSPAARKRFESGPEGRKFLAKLRQEAEKLGYAIGWTEGFAQGCVMHTLDVLKARGLTVSAEQRKTILACRDEQQLSQWIRRVNSVHSAAELFAGLSEGSGGPTVGRRRAAQSGQARTNLDVIAKG